MYCLFNGEHGYHELSEINMSEHQIEKTLDIQRNAYSNYIGNQYGDFLCKKIEYDWGKHLQVWTLECLKCGDITVKENGYTWSRGKSGSMKCHCEKDKKASEKIAKKTKKAEADLQKEFEIASEVGKIYGNFRIISCCGFGESKCVVKCIKCGAERKSTSINKLKLGIYPSCNCGKNNYDDQSWIGKRFGHLTIKSREGFFFIAKCDCGREKRCEPYQLCVQKRYLDCGDPSCKYVTEMRAKQITAKQQGDAYERITEAIVECSGYSVKRIGKTGDYGVDIIASKCGEKDIAIQCKCNTKTKIGVSSIQEVYAGGRFYGLERFAIVAFNGVSSNAINMARVLGVYICDNYDFNPPSDNGEYAKSLLPTYNHMHEINKKYYDIDGEKKTLGEWCLQYNVSQTSIRNMMKSGLSLKSALEHSKTYKGKRKTYTVDGYTGTLTDVCNRYGVLPATVAYRMKYKNMSIEQAIKYNLKDQSA